MLERQVRITLKAPLDESARTGMEMRARVLIRCQACDATRCLSPQERIEELTIQVIP